MSETKLEGGCQCGAVRYDVTGAPVMTAICHCSMCRRANAAPAVAWAMFQEQQVNFTGAHPKLYASSEQAQRGFCEICGTRSEEHTSELQSLMRISYAVFCLKKKTSRKK